MIGKFLNKTSSPQQIMLCDGSAKNVAPSEEVEIDLDLIFNEELERLKLFFIINKTVNYSTPKRITKKNYNEYSGGNE